MYAIKQRETFYFLYFKGISDFTNNFITQTLVQRMGRMSSNIGYLLSTRGPYMFEISCRSANVVRDIVIWYTVGSTRFICPRLLKMQCVNGFLLSMHAPKLIFVHLKYFLVLSFFMYFVWFIQAYCIFVKWLFPWCLEGIGLPKQRILFLFPKFFHSG